MRPGAMCVVGLGFKGEGSAPDITLPHARSSTISTCNLWAFLSLARTTWEKGVTTTPGYAAYPRTKSCTCNLPWSPPLNRQPSIALSRTLSRTDSKSTPASSANGSSKTRQSPACTCSNVARLRVDDAKSKPVAARSSTILTRESSSTTTSSVTKEFEDVPVGVSTNMYLSCPTRGTSHVPSRALRRLLIACTRHVGL